MTLRTAIFKGYFKHKMWAKMVHYEYCRMDVTILNGLLRPISLLLQYKNTGKTGDLH